MFFNSENRVLIISAGEFVPFSPAVLGPTVGGPERVGYVFKQTAVVGIAALCVLSIVIAKSRGDQRCDQIEGDEEDG